MEDLSTQYLTLVSCSVWRYIQILVEKQKKMQESVNHKDTEHIAVHQLLNWLGAFVYFPIVLPQEQFPD